MSAALNRLERLAAAMARIPETEFDALTECLNELAEEARETAHTPALGSDARPYWNGVDGGLTEALAKLRGLRSGAWKQWPDVVEARKHAADDQD